MPCLYLLGLRALPHLTVLLSLTVLTAQVQAESAASPPKWVNYGVAKTLLSQPGGLEAAAVKAKHLIILPAFPQGTSLTLPDLVKASDVILVGRAGKKLSRLDLANNSVKTDQEIQMDLVLKGNAPQQLIVTLPGGLYVFSDQAIAEVQTPESQHIHERTELVLFLSN